jgi:hypothetical protein
MIGQKHSDRMRSSRKSAKAEWARSIARVTLASIATSRSRHRGPQADALHYDVAPDGGRFLIITPACNRRCNFTPDCCGAELACECEEMIPVI